MTASAVLAAGRVTKLCMAVHEAGHAVAGIVMESGTVERMWLERLPRGWSGYVARRSFEDFDPAKEAAIALAGPIAEHAWLSRHDPDADVASFADGYAKICFGWGGVIEDFQKAKANAVAAFGAEQAQPSLANLWRETASLLKGQWPVVVKLAKALRDADALDRDEISRIVGR